MKHNKNLKFMCMFCLSHLVVKTLNSFRVFIAKVKILELVNYFSIFGDLNNSDD